MIADKNIQSYLGKTFLSGEEFKEYLLPHKRLLGIDLGTKNIGLALSDVSRTIASPLKKLSRTKFSSFVQILINICSEHQITGLILGLPRNMDGSYGRRAQSSKAFAQNLNKISALPILLWDERLTTAQAERMLISADLTRKRRKDVIDKLAATIILQTALDYLRR